jgi:secreted PhoX family phosphatase
MSLLRKKLLLLLAALIACSVLVIGCDGDDDDDDDTSSAPQGSIVSVVFEELSIPATYEEGANLRASSKATVKYDDGVTVEYPLSAEVLYKTGDSDSHGTTVGAMIDKYGDPITMTDGNTRLSNQPDAASFFSRGGKYYHLQQFEDSPGALYLTELGIGEDGSLTPVMYTNTDFSGVEGTMINCSGQKSPWDTHLSAEEDYYFSSYHFDPIAAQYDAQHVDYCEKDGEGNYTGGYIAPEFAPTADNAWWCAAYVKGMITDYLKTDLDGFSEYNYGYVVEVDVDDAGAPFVKNGMKHFSTGKFTPEVAVVMPDNKTMYMLDDGSYTGMFMYKADTARDLSEGTLYMAHINQVSPDNADGGTLGIQWIRLGHASDEEIAEYISRDLHMSDMFDIEDPEDCPANFEMMNVYDTNGASMCVRLKDGTNGSSISSKFASAAEVHQAAAFLEPRKYGVLLGGTTEFSKGEGVTYDWDNNYAYFVMSRVEASMTAGQGTTPTRDDIRLKQNKCGVMFKGTFGPGIDSEGNSIDSSYIVESMTGVVIGKKLSEGDAGADFNYCAEDYPADPDNILYMGKNHLFIAEDTGYHFYNMIWDYNTVTGDLTRIGTVPPGAEVTGAFGNISVDDKMYVTFNAQHPFGESRSNATGSISFSDYYSLDDEKYKGIIGYIKGLPSLK